MKKILAFLLASLMLLSLTACAGNNANNTTTTAAPTSSVIKPTELKEGTRGTAMWETFEKYVTENPEATPDEIAQILCDKLQENEDSPMMGVMPIEPGYLPGLSPENTEVEIKGFKSGATFAPMIGSIAFVGYVFELEEGADAEAFIAELEKNANPRWNICVEASETVIGAVDNLVLFVMTPDGAENS